VAFEALRRTVCLPVPSGKEVEVTTVFDDIGLYVQDMRPSKGKHHDIRLLTPSFPFSPPQFNPIGNVEGRELNKMYSELFFEIGMKVLESTSVT